MKFKSKLLLSVSAALLPCASFADVTVSIPRDVQMMIVNGKDIGYSNFGFDYEDKLILPDGTNQIVFRIAKVVTEAGSKSTKFKSHPMVATFTSADTELELKVPRIGFLNQGNEFNRNPSFSLEDKNGPIDIKTGQIKVGFTIMPDMVQEVANFNASSEPASLKSITRNQASASVTQTSPADADATQTGTASDIELMQKMFSQASVEDRRAFLSWAINNIE